MKTFTIIFIILFLLGCKKRENQPKSDLIIFDLKDFSEISKVKLTDIGVSEIQYIPLETNANSIISNIIQLISTNNGIYINNITSILHFSPEGKFIENIGNRGRGPNEFLLPNNVSIDLENNWVSVLSTMEHKIYVYTLDGKFVKSISVPDRTTRINCLAKNIVCYNKNSDGTVKNTFTIIDYDGNILRNYSNKYNFKLLENPVIIGDECYFSLSDKGLFFKEDFSDTVFYFNNIDMLPSFIINFGEKTFTPEVKGKVLNFDNLSEIYTKYVIGQNLIVLKDYIYYEFAFNHKSYTFLGDIKEGTYSLTDHGIGFINDIDGGVNFRFKSKLNDKTLISWIDALELKQHIESETFKNSTPKYPEKKKQLEQLANSLDENDNPVLMLVKLKE